LNSSKVLVAKLCHFGKHLVSFLLGLFKHSLYLVVNNKALIKAHLILNGLMQGN
jgi:hypothetical protein